MQQYNNPRRSSVDSKKGTDRRPSTSSSIASSISERRNSDVTPPTSRAPSIDGRSFISQNSIPQRRPSRSNGVDNTNANKQTGPTKYADVFSKPGLKAFTIDESKRLRHGTRRRVANLRMRRITQSEEEAYNKYPSINDSLANTASDHRSIYQAAAGYMLDFDIVRSKTNIPSSIRLSHVQLDGKPKPDSSSGDDLRLALLRVIRKSQAQLNMEGSAASIELPKGIFLQDVTFLYGLNASPSRPSSGLLTADLSKPDDSMSTPAAVISSFDCHQQYRRGYYLEPDMVRENKAYALKKPPKCSGFKLVATLPWASSTDSCATSEVYWYQLRGLNEAFPDKLYGTSEQTLQEWLGPILRSRSQYFELRDIQRNFNGDVLSARLLRVAGPKFEKFAKAHRISI